MSEVRSTTAADPARLRRDIARLLQEMDHTQSELITSLQHRHNVPETICRRTIAECVEHRLLYRRGDGADAEVVLP